MAVNLSARHLDGPGVAERLAAVAAAAGCPPALLLVEITETSLTSGTAQAGIRAIADLGCQVAVDEYGTGYSSLAQLKRLPGGGLVKIDRSFVAGLEIDAVDTTLVRSTLALAAALGQHVVAEGIETRAQLRSLVSLGCRRGQGFLLARPADTDTATRWLTTGLDVAVPALLAQPRA